MGEPVLLSDFSNPAIAVLTLNRPQKRNALSIELTSQLANAVAKASSEPGRRVIVIRGNGPVFCAGLDLDEAAEESKSDRSAQGLARAYLAISRSPLVTIASAQGAAMGGGAGLIAACDLTVGSDDLRIGFPEVHRGLVAGLVTALLCRQIGEKDIRRIILLGQTLDAESSLKLGLVQSLVPAAQLLEATMKLAESACEGAPGAIARTKRLLDDLGGHSVEDDIQRALRDHLEARNSGEAKEGIAAFREKRKPRW